MPSLRLWILSLEAVAYLGNHHFGCAARVGSTLAGREKEPTSGGGGRELGINSYNASLT